MPRKTLRRKSAHPRSTSARPTIERLEALQLLSALPPSLFPTVVAEPTPQNDPLGTLPTIPGNWNLSFDDEFDGTSLNAPWRPVQTYSANATAPPGELETYTAAGVSVNQGILRLTAQKQPTNGRAYLSGLVQAGGEVGATRPSFSFL